MFYLYFTNINIGDIMNNLQLNKLNTIINLFEGNEIRSIWDGTIGDYYFSVIDVIGVLTDNDHQKARNYW